MCPANSFFWLLKFADKYVIYYGDFYDLAPLSQKPFRSYFISKQAIIHSHFKWKPQVMMNWTILWFLWMRNEDLNHQEFSLHIQLISTSVFLFLLSRAYLSVSESNFFFKTSGQFMTRNMGKHPDAKKCSQSIKLFWIIFQYKWSCCFHVPETAKPEIFGSCFDILEHTIKQQ